MGRAIPKGSVSKSLKVKPCDGRKRENSSVRLNHYPNPPNEVSKLYPNKARNQLYSFCYQTSILTSIFFRGEKKFLKSLRKKHKQSNRKIKGQKDNSLRGNTNGQ